MRAKRPKKWAIEPNNCSSPRKFLSYKNTFQVVTNDQKVETANWENGQLVATNTPREATKEEITNFYEQRVIPLLTNQKGEILTFEKAHLNLSTYLTKNESSGYANLPYKLFYKVLGNDQKPYAYIFPINGYGLWDAIYAFLALKPDMNTILGISWYEQKETPGLGAEISTEWWQKQFYGKTIFPVAVDGKVDLTHGTMGINIVPTGTMGRLPSYQKKHAVDAVTGATMTMHGVQRALTSSLDPYRPLILKLRKDHE